MTKTEEAPRGLSDLRFGKSDDTVMFNYLCFSEKFPLKMQLDSFFSLLFSVENFTWEPISAGVTVGTCMAVHGN